MISRLQSFCTSNHETPNARPQARTVVPRLQLHHGDVNWTSVNVLIDGVAHEGVLKNPDRLGQSNYKAAYGANHWWLKRRWSRLAVITAVASRHGALRYVGGSAQRQAATQHSRAQEQDDCRFDSAFRKAGAVGFSQGWGARFKT